MNQLNPYISFPGNCEEAINFYKDCLDGEILSLNYFEGSPMEVAEDFKKKVMHVTMKFSGGIIMASDSPPHHPVNMGNNINLSIGLDDTDKANEYFNKLSEGGKVMMEMQDTFWGARFGMFTDKYGINWMINCEIKK
ncbi:MAG TPA: VOC family protein [Ignavibacteria bacterium]|nr:VOC family protein [Ignavibacteria bacterium]